LAGGAGDDAEGGFVVARVLRMVVEVPRIAINTGGREHDYCS
jgi:hypothetical protein